MAFKTNPNQRVVRVGDKAPCDDKGNTYIKVNKAVMFAAMRDLRDNAKSKGAFDLWMYFASNTKGFECAIGPSCDCCTLTGLKKAGYENAFNDLVARGYLVPIKEGSNTYVFYEEPQLSEKTTENIVAFSENHEKFSEKTTDGILRKPQQLSEKTRNITDITINTTKDTKVCPSRREEKDEFVF